MVNGSNSGNGNWIEKWITQHPEQIKVRRGPISEGNTQKWEIECPFQPGYGGANAAIFQGSDGKLGFKCFCGDHEEKNWRDLRELVEPAAQRVKAGAHIPAEPQIRSILDVPLIEGFGSTEINYLIRDVIPEAVIVLLTGGFGCGKSSLVARWAGDLAAQGRPVLILDRENPISAVRDRFSRLGLASGPLLIYWGGWLPESAPQPGSPIVLDWVKSCDPKPLIVVDSFTAFLQGDENDAQTVRAWFDSVVRPVVHLGATVVTLHNDGKSETARDFRGSSAIGDAVDVGYHVTNTSSNHPYLEKLHLRPYKLRVGKPEDGGTFRYNDGQFSRDCGTTAIVKTVPEQLTALLRANPGIKAKAFEDLANDHKLGRDRAREFLSQGVLAKRINREPGANNSKCHYLVESDGTS